MSDLGEVVREFTEEPNQEPLPDFVPEQETQEIEEVEAVPA